MTEFLSLDELSRYCRVERAVVVEWVELGVVAPLGHTPAEWRFPAHGLARVAQVARLARELDLAPFAAALVHDLLAERRRLEARLRALGDLD